MENPLDVILKRFDQQDRQISTLTSMVARLQGEKETAAKPMNAAEAADFLHMKKNALYQKIGQIPHRKINKRLLFFRSELLAYIEKNAVHSHTEA
ncbi:helix-turn-helix domain-containing protein [Tellurirhabdus bombi]|uniref:helix-turn-helix domain-containing protein n=1 Tax=Tellurirhabdus bombi TaxID=2907205 RepID=UPI001F43556D|nr:helix-turn-helix domain-containing protein [Tellurirhabdus bombi]